MDDNVVGNRIRYEESGCFGQVRFDMDENIIFFNEKGIRLFYKYLIFNLRIVIFARPVL